MVATGWWHIIVAVQSNRESLSIILEDTGNAEIFSNILLILK